MVFKGEYAMSEKILYIIWGVDWTSFKVTCLISFPALFIGTNAMQILGGISLLSNIVYNAYRIYKLHKNKKENE
jgi:hypothetical protein